MLKSMADIFFPKLTSAKLSVRMPRLASGFIKLVKSPGIVLQVLVVLRIDSVDLSLCGTCREQWRHKELCKPL